MKRIVVGLSGGVDSSVAAYLLKKQGYDVVGLYMINWHDVTGTLSGDCPWKDDLLFAELVAKKLNIPFHTVDFSEKYRQRVVDYMFKEYQAGRTPNPDVLCNREVKFDLFLDKAIELGANYIATGHYCKKETIARDGKQIHRLLMGDDPNKEQSYFLCQLSQKQLEKALFPIGHIHKPEIRKIAEEQKLPTADKKDSQGICFVGKVDLPVFLQQKLEPKKGNIIEIPADSNIYEEYYDFDYQERLSDEQLAFFSKPIDYLHVKGIKVGEHNGAHFFTIGQRKGLNVGGKPKPLFVIATNVDTNVIYTGQGDDHPGLNQKVLSIKPEDIHWIREDLQMKEEETRQYDVRIRYRQPVQKAMVYRKKNKMYIVFDKLQRGITPGQFAAWYKEGELIGSGVIGND